MNSEWRAVQSTVPPNGFGVLLSAKKTGFLHENNGREMITNARCAFYNLNAHAAATDERISAQYVKRLSPFVEQRERESEWRRGRI